jgi:hypothetical protein
MVGNMVKGICDNWTGTLNGSWSIDTKGGTKLMIAMVGAILMYG